MSVFFLTGDLGDTLAALPIIRHLGGGELVLGPHVGPGGPREPMTESRFRFIAPLIAVQPYISMVTFEEKPDRITHDLSLFRATCRYHRNELLTYWMARHCGFKDPAAEIDLSPWLAVEPSLETKGKVVLARSPRYHNRLFKWQNVVRRYRGRAIFFGLPDEHSAFTNANGFVPHRSVDSALEMAELIAGSLLFVGNQSLPCWLAMGLGHTLIQESCAGCLNSKIIRPNASYVTGGLVFTEKSV